MYYLFFGALLIIAFSLTFAKCLIWGFNPKSSIGQEHVSLRLVMLEYAVIIMALVGAYSLFDKFVSL
jgi:hypothetical protein